LRRRFFRRVGAFSLQTDKILVCLPFPRECRPRAQRGIIPGGRDLGVRRRRQKFGHTNLPNHRVEAVHSLTCGSLFEKAVEYRSSSSFAAVISM